MFGLHKVFDLYDYHPEIRGIPEIEPCPICGRKPIIYVKKIDNGGYDVIIECNPYSLFYNPFKAPHKSIHHREYSDYALVIKNAVEKGWNENKNN